VIHSGLCLAARAGCRKGKDANKTAHTPIQTYANLLRLQPFGDEIGPPGLNLASYGGV
jgi:hypothetical protein